MAVHGNNSDGTPSDYVKGVSKQVVDESHLFDRNLGRILTRAELEEIIQEALSYAERDLH